jgi:hypothetical protein
MRPVRNVFQKLSRTEQRREGVVAYLWLIHSPLFLELGTRSFFRGSLSAHHSIFSPGSLTLMRSFFEFPFSLVAQTLIAQPVVR